MDQFDYIALPIVVNVVVSLPESAVAAVPSATTIAAARTPYSNAVTPLRSWIAAARTIITYRIILFSFFPLNQNTFLALAVCVNRRAT